MNDKYPDFIPEWTKAIIATHARPETRYMSTTQIIDSIQEEYGLNYCRNSCCLTGEGFFHKGAPEKCTRCNDFTYEGAHGAIASEYALYMFKELFAAHLQEKHPAVWKKWGIK